MKKFFKVAALSALLAVSAMSFAACGGGDADKDKDQDKDTATSWKDKEVILVGTDNTYPPMEFVDEDGKTSIGFDIDVAEAIFAEMGKKVEIVPINWDGIFSGLESKKYDVVISSVSLTPERQEKYAMTKAYVSNKLVLVTAPGTTDITSLETLGGKRVVTQVGTTADDKMIEIMGDDSDIIYNKFDTVMQAFDELTLGRADAVLVDIVVAKYYIAKDPSKYEIVWESEDSEPIGICIRKEDQDLADEVNKAIDALYASGKMGEISEKWFGEDITAVE
ncbi:MAG: amino acid ABC transporter substrate-binding protein [Peptococcaceae bacterium]|nr:amino acid ABC transporter substrate-binding protein [Peptococcaceae bacterium]